MPTFEASFKDFEKLVGEKLPKTPEKLWKKLLLVKSEVEELDIKNDIIKFEPADSNRPDMWHVEGLARALKGALGIETGIPTFEVKASNDELIVDKSTKKVRPYIACAVIKGIKFTDFLTLVPFKVNLAMVASLFIGSTSNLYWPIRELILLITKYKSL